jgi:TldD protein
VRLSIITGCGPSRRTPEVIPLTDATSILDGDSAGIVLAAALRAGAEWAELYVEEREGETVRLDGGQVAELRSDRDVGASVRAIAGDTVGLAYTNRLTTEALVEAAQAASAAASAAARDPGEVRVDLTELEVTPVQSARTPPSTVSSAHKVELLRRADSAARSYDGSVRDVTAIHVDVDQRIVVATSDGLLAHDHRVRSRLTCRVTARRDGRTETGFDGPGLGGGLELYDVDTPELIASRAAERSVNALAGSDPPVGAMPVVLGPGGGGLLLHEACGHGLEADGLDRESSIYARTVGKRIASPLVTAVDDPSRPAGFGSYGVDDEGSLSARTVLIDAGVQVGALTDRATAARSGNGITANGRRSSYAKPPLPRMSNTYIEPGLDDTAAVLADVGRGLYVTRLRGGDVNVATGEFAFSAAESYLVEKGKLTRLLTGVTLLGNGPSALAAVDAVGSDLAFTEALCGKDDQWVPVSYGAPTLRIASLTVAGNT